jgi:hypothetical protein
MPQELKKFEIRMATAEDYHAITDLLTQSFEEVNGPTSKKTQKRRMQSVEMDRSLSQLTNRSS